MRATGETRPIRTFWWDREIRTEADALRAVIFDADSVLAGVDHDGDDAARTELVDAVMSLFVAGVWVGVVSIQPRAQVEAMVRRLLGDGLVETIVTVDDLADPDPDAALSCGSGLYRLALWEMGITSRDALAVAGADATVPIAMGLPTVGVDEVRSAASCQQAHRRWWIRHAA